MTKIFVVASGKGGVGKSTLTVCLGKVLASMDKKTLIIDTDMGLAGLDIMLGVADRNAFNWLDVIEGNCGIADTIISVSDNLDLIPAPNTFIDGFSPESFRSAMSDISDFGYDFIFLDAPAGLGAGLQLAATLADRALIVTTADNVSTKAAQNVREALEEFGVRQSRLIINRFRKKPTIRGSYLNIDAAIDSAAVQLIGIAPEDYGVQFLAMQGEFRKNKKITGLAFERIARRLCGETVELEVKKL